MGEPDNEQYKLNYFKGAFMKEPERKRSISFGRIGRLINIMLGLATLVGLAGLKVAQNDQGRISGLVSDQNHGLGPCARINVKNERTGESRTATSNQDGAFTVSNLK